MTRWLFASCLLAMAATSGADERGDAWTVGMQEFQAGRERMQAGQPSRAEFRRAAVAFAAAVDPLHAETHLNLGNAHFLAGELPEAITSFNAGLLIDPSNSSLHENLAHARRAVTLPTDSKLVAPSPAWQRYLFQTWIDIVAVIALMGSSLLVPASIRLGRRSWGAIGLALAMIAAVGGSAIIVRSRYVDEIERRPVCVIRVDTPLRIGNAESYATQWDAPLLPRGYEVHCLGDRGGWLHVECPGGPIGWVPEKSVIRVAAP